MRISDWSSDVCSSDLSRSRDVASIAIEDRERNRDVGNKRPVAGLAKLPHTKADRGVKTTVGALALEPGLGDEPFGFGETNVERSKRVHRRRHHPHVAIGQFGRWDRTAEQGGKRAARGQSGRARV